MEFELKKEGEDEYIYLTDICECGNINREKQIVKALEEDDFGAEFYFICSARDCGYGFHAVIRKTSVGLQEGSTNRIHFSSSDEYNRGFQPFIEKLIDEKWSLAVRHPQNIHLLESLAFDIFSSWKVAYTSRDVNTATARFEELFHLGTRNPKNGVIASLHARTLFSHVIYFSRTGEFDIVEDTCSNLESLWKHHSSEVTIAAVLASTYGLLAERFHFFHNSQKTNRYLKKCRKLADKFKAESEIQVFFINALTSIGTREGEEENLKKMVKMIDEVVKYAKNNPHDPDVQTQLAKALYNMKYRFYAENDFSNGDKYGQMILEIVSRFPQNTELQAVVANSHLQSIIISVRHDKLTRIQQELKFIEEIAELNSHSEEIQLILSRGLYHTNRGFANANKLQEIDQNFKKLRKISTKYTTNDMIQFYLVITQINVITAFQRLGYSDRVHPLLADLVNLQQKHAHNYKILDAIYQSNLLNGL